MCDVGSYTFLQYVKNRLLQAISGIIRFSPGNLQLKRSYVFPDHFCLPSNSAKALHGVDGLAIERLVTSSLTIHRLNVFI